jgi:hypothetical protein
MLSSKHRRTLVLSLALSAGALALPPVEASSVRSPRPSAVQTELFTRSLIDTVKNLWEWLKDAPPGSSHGKPPQHRGDEGPSVCPHGGHPHP